MPVTQMAIEVLRFHEYPVYGSYVLHGDVRIAA